jgi:hypothetical protein
MGTGELTVARLTITMLETLEALELNITFVEFCFSEFNKWTGSFRQRAVNIVSYGYASDGETRNIVTVVLMETH